MQSDKPEAKPFQNWVTKVVPPAIRKDGGYIQGEKKVVTGETPMNAQLTVTDNSEEAAMSSLVFLNETINPAREAAGESLLHNTEMVRKIEDQSGALGGLQNFCATASRCS